MSIYRKRQPTLRRREFNTPVPVEQIVTKAEQLPPSELRYWVLALAEQLPSLEALAARGKQAELIAYQEFVMGFYHLVELFDKPQIPLQDLVDHLEHFKITSGVYSVVPTVANIVAKIISIATATVSAVLFGTMGLIVGAFSRANIFKGAATGFAAGVALGAIVGYRLPRKIFQASTTRIKRAFLDQINISARDESELGNHENFNFMLKFKEDYGFLFDQKGFEEFLTTTHEITLATRDVNAIPGFEGIMGQHAFIEFEINGNKNQTMELNRDNSSSATKKQQVTRTVTGEQLYKMLRIHDSNQQKGRYSLQQGGAPSFAWFKQYKIAERDCHTYVDMLLKSVGEKPAGLKRIGDHEFVLTRKVLNPLLEYVSAAPSAA